MREPILIFFAAIIFLAMVEPQVLKTQLRITVLDELGNIQEGASVTLYKNQQDYRKEVNPVEETQMTDKKGRASFKKLEPKVYFVHVVKDDLNNDGAGVETDTLVAGKVNKVNIVIY